MDSNLIKFQKVISKSGLLKEDQDSFKKLFSKASSRDLKFIIDLFEKYPEQIEILNKFYKLKRETLKNKDKKAWNDILQQEYKILEEIENK